MTLLKKKIKLTGILLIDDDEPTNYMNEKFIREADCTDNIIIRESGDEGLEYLRNCAENGDPLPELIFLDINMPGMNGWDFLEEYKKLDESIQSEILLIMLTTSLNPDDKDRAEKIEEISGFINKPFSVETLNVVLETYFSE